MRTDSRTRLEKLSVSNAGAGWGRARLPAGHTFPSRGKTGRTRGGEAAEHPVWVVSWRVLGLGLWPAIPDVWATVGTTESPALHTPGCSGTGAGEQCDGPLGEAERERIEYEEEEWRIHAR